MQTHFTSVRTAERQFPSTGTAAYQRTLPSVTSHVCTVLFLIGLVFTSRAVTPAWTNVKDYGATTGDTTDDTAAINNAIAATTAGGVVYFPTGTYTIGSPVVVNKALAIEADGAVLNSTQTTANAVTLDFNNSGTSLAGVSLRGNLTVQRATADNTLGSIGIRLRNVYTSDLSGFTVKSFHYGLYLLGDGSGCVYNNIQPRMLQSNAYQIIFTTTSATGWANQNTVIGGRFTSSANTLATSAQIYIDNNGYGNNGNVFLNISLESTATPVPLAVYCNGSNNTFIGTRTEGSLAWTFAASSSSNLVMGGTYVNRGNLTDLGQDNRCLLPASGTTLNFMNGNMGVGKPVNGYGTAVPTNYVMVGTNALGESTGIYFPNMDGTQNTRAWVKVDAQAKLFELSHTWSSGGDLDYSINRGRLWVGSSGKVGVGTTAPSEQLEVNGAIKVGTRADTGASAGTIRWNATTSKLQVYTGTAWVDLH